MIIFDKFGLSDEDRALLAQQQADAVRLAVLEERNNHLAARLAVARDEGDQKVEFVFRAFELAGKLTGATEDRAASVAAVLSSAVQLFQHLAESRKRREETPEGNYLSVTIADVAQGFAYAREKPELGPELLRRLNESEEMFSDLGSLLTACDGLWRGMMVEEEEPQDSQGGEE